MNKIFIFYGNDIEKQNAIMMNTIGVEHKLMFSYNYTINNAYTFKNNKSPLQPFHFAGLDDVLENEYLTIFKNQIEKTKPILILWKAYMRWIVLYDNTYISALLTRESKGKQYIREMLSFIFSD